MESIQNKVSSPIDTTESRAESVERAQVRKQLERRRKFWGDVFAYVVINTLLVVIWATTNNDASFWPGWVMAGWGALLLLDAWNAFFRRPISEADVEAALHRLRSDRPD